MGETSRGHGIWCLDSECGWVGFQSRDFSRQLDIGCFKFLDGLFLLLDSLQHFSEGEVVLSPGLVTCFQAICFHLDNA